MRIARTAFTLIEILVVIAIIGILALLTVGAVTKVISGQSANNTRTVISTIDRTLKTHWAAVIADARKETGVDFTNIISVFGPDNTGGDLNRVIWVKLRLMEAFPISYAEIINPFPYNNAVVNGGLIPANLRKYNGTYLKTLQTSGSTGKDNRGGVTESSACLLMALSISRGGTSLKLEDLGSSSVADSDGDGVKEFIDAWGNPLSFFRFPTENWKLQNTNPGTKNPAKMYPDLNYTAASPFADPVDPAGSLFNWTGAGHKVFQKNVHKTKFNNNASCYIVPTIVSWGPDGDVNKMVNNNYAPYGLGLDNITNIPTPTLPPINPQLMAITDTTQEADDIYSFMLR